MSSGLVPAGRAQRCVSALSFLASWFFLVSGFGVVLGVGVWLSVEARHWFGVGVGVGVQHGLGFGFSVVRIFDEVRLGVRVRWQA